MTRLGRDRATMAALALAFDDRPLRRQLTIRDPDALERARLAFELVERRLRRNAGEARPAA